MRHPRLPASSLPHKGYACAYRRATGRDGCSGYGYRVIARFGAATGLVLLRRRLRLCGQTRRPRLVAPNPMLYYQRGDCDLPCDGGCVPDLPCSGKTAGRCLGDFLSSFIDCSCEPAPRSEEQKRQDELNRQQKKREKEARR